MERTALGDDGLSISRLVTGLWQIADMERDGGEVELDKAAAGNRRSEKPSADKKRDAGGEGDGKRTGVSSEKKRKSSEKGGPKSSEKKGKKRKKEESKDFPEIHRSQCKHYCFLY